MVARQFWELDVASSSLVTPTIPGSHNRHYGCFFMSFIKLVSVLNVPKKYKSIVLEHSFLAFTKARITQTNIYASLCKEAKKIKTVFVFGWFSECAAFSESRFFYHQILLKRIIIEKALSKFTPRIRKESLSAPHEQSL